MGERLLATAYAGGCEGHPRFEDKYFPEEISIQMPDGMKAGQQKINVYDSHAETMWWATAQACPNSMYPKKDADAKQQFLVPPVTRLVPPAPMSDGQSAPLWSKQGPVYAILEEEVKEMRKEDGTTEQVATGYITTGTVTVLDYFEKLDKDVQNMGGKKERYSGALCSLLGGPAEVTTLTHVDNPDYHPISNPGSPGWYQLEGKTVHIMNNRGVAQSLALNYVAASKMQRSIKDWADASARGDFVTGNYPFDFERGTIQLGERVISGYRVKDFDYALPKTDAGDPIGALGITFVGETGEIKSIKSGSPAATAGMDADKPWAYLVQDLPQEGPEGQTRAKLSRAVTIVEIRYARGGQADGPLADYTACPFSKKALSDLLCDQSADKIVLVRAPIADEREVRHEIDQFAFRKRTKAKAIMQETATKDGWFAMVEDLPEKAWPVLEKEKGKVKATAVNAMPACWPGYHMEDEDGNPIEWDPDKHEEPEDPEFFAREFVKTYSYVNARGSTKGPSGPSGDNWQGLSVLYAALYGYDTAGKGADNIYEKFPDRNDGARRSYQMGITSQYPKAWTAKFAEEANTAKQREEREFKGFLLRAAYFQGFNNSNRKPEDLVPDAYDLREAYKQGKRAVNIGITKEDWPQTSQNKALFVRLAVPVPYQFNGKIDDDQASKASQNWFFKQVWQRGVDDAWAARLQNTLTDWHAPERVPDLSKEDRTWISPRDAFKRGASASKAWEDHAEGSVSINMSNPCPGMGGGDEMVKKALDALAVFVSKDKDFAATGVVISNDQATVSPSDSEMRKKNNEWQPYSSSKWTDAEWEAAPTLLNFKAKQFALEDGLKLCFESYFSGKPLPKPDDRYPYTQSDLKKAFEDGAEARRRDDKKKIIAAVEVAPPEDDCMVTFMEHACMPCIAGYNSCFPMCTDEKDAGGALTGRTICCGSTYGDWLCILCCFFFWYTFCGLYFWTLIEIMFVVAEPARAW